MLPEYKQARKAIWTAVDAKTGKRRLDQAFPKALRRRTNDNEMFIEFVNGATWQVVGSDRFDSAVGAGPAGIVFSEWSLSNPRAWGTLAPMLEENGGWALFIYTARGANHGESTIKMAKETPGWFGEILTARDTGIFNDEQLARIRTEYIKLDPQSGEALFEQEYFCSFASATHGAYWAKEVAVADADGRICDVPVDIEQPVHTAWDLGVRDATAIWFFQVLAGGLNIVDFYEASGVGLDHYNDILRSRARVGGYQLGTCHVPHDAKVKEWGSGKTRLEQMEALGLAHEVVPDHRLMDGIGGARETLARVRFDRERCKDGVEALKQYRADYDEERKVLKPTPRHDWTSHAADAFRYLAMGWRDFSEPREDDAPAPQAGWMAA